MMARIAVRAAAVSVVAAAAGAVYGAVTPGAFSAAYVFPVMFSAGALVTCVGLAMLFLPHGSPLDRLTDHSTVMERRYDYRQRRGRAYRLVAVGIGVTVFAASLQMLLSVLLPGGYQG